MRGRRPPPHLPVLQQAEPQGFLEHYRTIADEVDLPQIVYNVPSRTGQSIPIDVTVELAEHPNIQGYKAASGDLNLISEVIERTRDEFSVLSGDDGLTLPVLSIGGTGTISVVGNVEPERSCAMVGAARSRAITTARGRSTTSSRRSSANCSPRRIRSR